MAASGTVTTCVADLDRFIGRLCRRFNVTKSVAAWKLEHGAFGHGVDLGRLLDEIVPQRRPHIIA